MGGLSSRRLSAVPGIDAIRHVLFADGRTGRGEARTPLGDAWRTSAEAGFGQSP